MPTAFLDTVRASGLLTPNQLAAASALPAGPPASYAAALVANGTLTRFQADRLLAGRAEGFHVGPYVLLEQIGRGSMGRVYKARHQTMNRAVAIKVLAATLTSTEAAKQAFHREVRAAAKLNHPNIVTAYDANEVGDRFYLVLEYVDGPTLDALVKARGPLPVGEACGYVRQIAAGLQHAHDQGMAHRDVKPSNVLVTRPAKTHAGGEVKIADFGLARLGPGAAAAPQSPPGALLGTPDFVAPEQAQDPRLADHRADLYSLGGVFYFLLTGRAPFPGGTAHDKVRRHLTEEPPRVELVRPDVPPGVAAVVHTLLAKHPLSRFGSAADVVERLDAHAEPDGAVSFEMPAAQSGPYSFAGSGGHPIPAPPAAETSPWAQLTDEACVGTASAGVDLTPLDTRVRRKRPTRGTPWAVVASVAGVVAVVLAVAVRALAK